MTKKRMYVVPHSHYDAAVFKAREEYLEIGYRNILDVLNLMGKDETYKFVLDQVACIQPFLEKYPEQKTFFKKMVGEKRLEIVGGMYVMPDVNIPSGESFIRQIIRGKECCLDKLGIDVKCGWMIDTFGHHPQIPQIMKKSGFDYYVFGRVMKADSPSEFYWQGIDGSKILCHWMPYLYVVLWPVPSNLFEFRTFAIEKYKLLRSYAVTSNILALSGADLVPPEPHLPELIRQFNKEEHEFELILSTPGDFFDLLKNKKNLPVITGDFNPIYQGCYSARIAIKQQNRLLENLLVTCEKLETISWLLGANAPEKDLSKAWDLVLFNQFHDVICGCHTDKVFENSMIRYKCAKMLADEQKEKSIDYLVDRIDTRGEGIPVVVFNQLTWQRNDLVECEVSFRESGVSNVGLTNASGNEIPVQVLEQERYNDGALKRIRILFVAEQVPSMGYEVYHVIPNHVVTTDTQVSSNLIRDGKFQAGYKNIGIIENEFNRLAIDLWRGVITSIKDKRNDWEIIAENNRVGNTLVKELDRGDFWQYNGSVQASKTISVPIRYPFPSTGEAEFSYNQNGYGHGSCGPVMGEINLTHPFGPSKFSVAIRVYHKLSRIEISTSLVNNEEWVRYRAAIPTSIKNGQIVHEIPFGTIERPEGEYPAQNWVDYYDGTKGVALLNQGLPGNNVVDGIMMLSLLKCTTFTEYPDVGGYEKGIPANGGFEKGKEHHFRYAILPHEGDWRKTKLYRRGLEFNNPLLAKKDRPHAGKLPSKHSFLKVSANNIVVSAFKKSDDNVMLRLYEAEGKTIEEVELRLNWRIESGFEADLMERNKSRARTDGNSVRFGIKPFEIKTFILRISKEQDA